MANQKVSQLTAASALTGAEQAYVVQSANSRRTTTQDIANLAPGTDLSYTASSRLLASSTGADVTLPVATTSLAGLLSAADKTKLDGLSTFDPASPGAIGGTVAAAGSFTTLSASSRLNVPSSAAGSPAARDVYAVADTLRYRDSGNVERLLLNATDNLANLSNTATARTNLGLGTAATSASTAFAASGLATASGLTMSTARLLGRSTASTGAVEEISLPTGFGLTSGALTAPAEIGIACSDETTALTTGTAKVTFRMPYAMTLTAVRLSVTTAPTGSALIVNIKEAGTTIFSTKPQIDAAATTSVGSGTAAVISDSALADNAVITIDIDQIGSTVAGAGLKVWLIGRRA